jgi:hypothetical protein
MAEADLSRKKTDTGWKDVKRIREIGISHIIFGFNFSHIAMRKRKVPDDNEWAGWLHWMRHIFRSGTIKETWKQIELDKWFNPDFQNFINSEIVGAKLTW